METKCRCQFRRLDENGECWAQCKKRVESCEVCALGGGEGTRKKRKGAEMTMDYLGFKDWCKMCKHGKTKGINVFCDNKKSKFYSEKTNSLRCSPCFEKKDSRS